MSPSPFVRPPTDTIELAVRRVWLTLGGRIRDARLARLWNVPQLAERAGVSRRNVYLVEAGESASVESAVRLASALGLRLDCTLVDPRKRANAAARTTDSVHSFMGEFEATGLRMPGYRVGIDEPYQHYQFAGRADLVAWDLDARALLHVENRTRFPDFQERAGSFNAKRAYLGAAIADRLGLYRWSSQTHVIAALWSAEVLHSLRMRPESFRTLCPDPPDDFTSWWMGRPPAHGRTSILIVLDPLATLRQRRWISLDDALRGARPRHRGYADVVARLGEAA